jgi:hypothetical protein
VCRHLMQMWVVSAVTEEERDLLVGGLVSSRLSQNG